MGGSPLIGLHPGARDPARRWPAERFAALADALVERHGARIVLTGDAGEREIVAAVRGAMRGAALDLTGRTGLGLFAATVARLDLLVTNDTGASHLAAAARTPSVVLFGPTSPEHWGPPADRPEHVALWAGHRGDPHGEAPDAGLLELRVRDVLAALETLPA